MLTWLKSKIRSKIQRLYKDKKVELFRELDGVVVEVGPGTGVNLQFLPAGIKWIGVEPNNRVIPFLKKEIKQNDIDGFIVKSPMSYNQTPIATGSVDFVIGTFVLCSVHDIDDVLAEIRRILKPGGKYLFLEHVAAPLGSRLRWWQNALTPLWQKMFGGCSPNLESDHYLTRVGFRDYRLDTFNQRMISPIVRPHIVGWVQK